MRISDWSSDVCSSDLVTGSVSHFVREYLLISVAAIRQSAPIRSCLVTWKCLPILSTRSLMPYSRTCHLFQGLCPGSRRFLRYGVLTTSVPPGLIYRTRVEKAQSVSVRVNLDGSNNHK